MNGTAITAPLANLWDATPETAEHSLRQVFATDAVMQLAHPFNTLSLDQFLDDALLPLYAAMPDLERRDMIVIKGHDANGAHWVGRGGHYAGTFQTPWLNIPATGRAASMRFHEFYRIENGKAVEFQALWDIPELMMQANAWPMSPSLGRDWNVPGPHGGDVQGDGATTLDIVSDMLVHLGKHATEGVDAMRLDAFWHPKCSWYGPAGIGTTRGIAGFRAQHQIPFLNAMPDRVGGVNSGHLFAQGDFVGFTAWPGMQMSLTGDGWLGIAPSGRDITMRSLDFWRVENGLIRENWVLVDLLHVYDQLGVDVLARMAQLPTRGT